jgi:hypothetical protein
MIPGVESAGISDNLPMSRNRSWGIAAKGGQKRDALDYVPVFVYIVSRGYVKAIQRWVLIYNVVSNIKQIVFQGLDHAPFRPRPNRPEIFMPAAV